MGFSGMFNFFFFDSYLLPTLDIKNKEHLITDSSSLLHLPKMINILESMFSLTKTAQEAQGKSQ